LRSVLYTRKTPTRKKFLLSRDLRRFFFSHPPDDEIWETLLSGRGVEKIAASSRLPKDFRHAFLLPFSASESLFFCTCHARAVGDRDPLRLPVVSELTPTPHRFDFFTSPVILFELSSGG